LPIATMHVVLSAVYMIAMLSLQLFYFSRPFAQLHSPAGYLALLAQALLVYLPLLEFKQAWVGLPGFLAGSVLLVLPPTLGWISFGLVAASMAVVQGVFTGQPIDIAYTTVSTVISGLVVYGLTRLASLVTELHAAQNELAKMAVAQERLRFARDLHDLLGYSLSAITLKSELTHRLVTKNPGKAQEELAEILDIGRKALSDVRSVASGYRELSLDNESRSARSVLIAADVEVNVVLDYDDLPTNVKTVLATVLREGVTNVLRHSKAERCDITVRQEGGRVSLDIVNDGVQPVQQHSDGGSGVRNLSTRIAALDGEIFAGLEPDGRYRLHVSVPLAQARVPAG
ncbi:MAG TPA: histidine kinase, partial [Pseudonocardiaceae bacterium]|nr:histidine kinase [Pseudonocardiaceae bacterium]